MLELVDAAGAELELFELLLELEEFELLPEPEEFELELLLDESEEALGLALP